MLSYRKQMDWNSLWKRIALPFLLLALAAPALPADAMQDAGIFLIRKYNEALREQQNSTRNLSMTVTMEARIPKLKKQGKLSALRRISSLGHITYKALGFQGDDVVKREVMARYMNAEQEASEGPTPNSANLAITPENYQFKYKGLNNRNGRAVHIFELKPKEKRVGLFKGELWIDPETSLPVREQGQLVKNPSVFVKKMQFLREYEIKDGVSLLKHMEARTDTRIIGAAELAIDFDRAEHVPVEDQPVEEARQQ